MTQSGRLDDATLVLDPNAISADGSACRGVYLVGPLRKAQLWEATAVPELRVLAADVVKLQSVKAVSGDTIAIAAHGNGVTVDKAHVVKTDITATNGVIHVIDAVIIPAER